MRNTFYPLEVFIHYLELYYHPSPLEGPNMDPCGTHKAVLLLLQGGHKEASVNSTQVGELIIILVHPEPMFF